MKKRRFGNTDLYVSEIGFGAWGIGGPAMAGSTPIGWGNVDDRISIKALEEAKNGGINFFDTADFYGLGHSEELIGKVFGNKPGIIVATKVGHRLNADQTIRLDYSEKHILSACEKSLKRLNRECIDYYQLHSATVQHLETGECIEAMEKLQKQGKIRYWGISLNTYNPFPEAQFSMENSLGSGFQFVLNIINQKALPIIKKASKKGYGTIARMPLQFGLLTGKFNSSSRFDTNDHRRFRLKPVVLENALNDLEQVWPLARKSKMTKSQFSLNSILSNPEISTVIPGMKTPEQVIDNTTGISTLDKDTMSFLNNLWEAKFKSLLELMEEQER
jgi:aryl-alcohol dehydrogenase-like predicted oxidoreductase